MKKTSLITGLFGQDGSYLAELLSRKGYEVHGVARTPLGEASERIARHLTASGISPVLHACDLNDPAAVGDLIGSLKPDECYHLAATHFSSEATAEERSRIAARLYRNNVLSGSNLIHAVQGRSPSTRLVLAGSCLMYDATDRTPQDEGLPYRSNSAYGLSKIAVAELAKAYRERDGLHLSNAALYNHESPRRPDSFVTRKIAEAVAGIKKGEIDSFVLGNVNARKDWGFAGDYVEGLWRMAQQPAGDDFILATGVTHSVEEFLVHAFRAVGVSDWTPYVKVNDKLATSLPIELRGDASKAARKLSWKPAVGFPELVERMVKASLNGRLE